VRFSKSRPRKSKKNERSCREIEWEINFNYLIKVDMEQITELGKTRTKNITDLIIAQAMAEQVEYRPDILRKKYPDDIK
jgi:hypothetical protein